MKILKLQKESYSTSDYHLYLSMSKEDALVLAQNILHQANCGLKEVEIQLSAKECP